MTDPYATNEYLQFRAQRNRGRRKSIIKKQIMNERNMIKKKGKDKMKFINTMSATTGPKTRHKNWNNGYFDVKVYANDGYFFLNGEREGENKKLHEEYEALYNMHPAHTIYSWEKIKGAIFDYNKFAKDIENNNLEKWKKYYVKKGIFGGRKSRRKRRRKGKKSRRKSKKRRKKTKKKR